MKKWIEKQNAYSIIKLLVAIAMLYSLLSSLIFSLGGCANLGSVFSGTISFYVGTLLITYTPKGRIYFTSFFRAGVYILLLSRLFNMLGIWVDISIQHKYSVIFVFAMTAFVFMVIGMILGKQTKINQNDNQRN